MTEESQKHIVNYGSNSNKNKSKDKQTAPTAPDRQAPEKVISGAAVEKKKTLGAKFRETFVGNDAKSVGRYLIIDVVAPAIKDLIFDVGSKGLSRILFGDDRMAIPASSSGIKRTGYSQMYRKAQEGLTNQRPSMGAQARQNHDFSEIFVTSSEDGWAAIEALQEQIVRYEVATVADLYSAVGITPEFTDNKWGWEDLGGSNVIQRGRERYQILVPRPIYIP